MSDMIKSNIIYSLPEKERALLQAQEANLSQYPQNILFTNDPICNLEIYSEDEYLETIVNVDYYEVGGSWYEENVGIEKGFRVNVPLILQQNGYTEGYFRVRVSFTIDLLGEAFNNQVYIKDISQDRTEVELGAIDPENSAVIDADGNPNSQFQKFVDLGGISSTGNKLIFNLKTATGKSYPIINQYYFDTTGLSRTSHTSPPNIPNSVFSVAIKLLEPIPAQLKKLEKVWVDIDVVPPRDIFVKLQKRYQDTEEYTSLAKPNFHAQYQGQFREGNTTNYLSSNDLLGTQQNVKDRIISEVLSGSLGGIKVNVDHRQFKNFVYFSSAEERIRNFHFKMQQLESFQQKINELGSKYSQSSAFVGKSAVTASAEFIVNRQKFEKRSQALIGTFDHFEKYMYYESSSFESSSYGLYPSIGWPKSTTEKPYKLYSYTSSQVNNWYGAIDQRQGILYSASVYDRENPYNLRKLIPLHVVDDPLNIHYTRFIDMMGHHFDVVYNLTNELGKINDRQEGLNNGMSKDIVYDVLKSFGWNPINGYHLEELWKYLIGTDSSGSYQTTEDGSSMVYVQTGSLSAEDITKTTWKRILTNLPHIYKTKGTRRSIDALLSCYGVPTSIVNVKEFGGPHPIKGTETKFEHTKFTYALKFHEGAEIRIPYVGMTADSEYVTELGLTGNVTASLPNTHEFRVNFSGSEKRNQIIFGRDLVSFGSEGPHDADGGNTPGLQRLGWCLFAEHSNSAHMSFKAGESPYGRFRLYITGSPGGDIGETSGTGSVAAKSAGSQSFIECHTGYLPIFDGDWWNVMVSVDGKREDGKFPGVGPIGASTAQSGSFPEAQWILRTAKAGNWSDGNITHSGSGVINLNEAATGPHSASFVRSWARTDLSGADFGFGAHIWGSTTPRKGLTQHLTASDFHDFTGKIQEYRAWAEVLKESTFHSHTLSPTSINGNTYTSSFDTLLIRYPFGTDLQIFNHATHSPATNALHNVVISSSHPGVRFADDRNPNASGAGAGEPNRSNDTNATASNWESAFLNSNNTHYHPQTEVYFTTVPGTIGDRNISQKIRVERTVTGSELQPIFKRNSVMSSSADLNPLDSNRLAVTISPTNNLDIDIAYQFGGLEFDDLVGDPRDLTRNVYSDLEAIHEAYTKKYAGGYDFSSFIRTVKFFNPAMFKQIEDLLPARANKFVGLEIRPTILERVKVPTPEGNAVDLQLTSSYGQIPTSSMYTHFVDETDLNDGFSTNLNTFKTNVYTKTHDGTAAVLPLTQENSSIDIKISATASSVYGYSSSVFGDNGDTGLFIVNQTDFQTMITASREDRRPKYEREFFYKAGFSGSFNPDGVFEFMTRYQMEATDQTLREKKQIGLFRPLKYFNSHSLKYSDVYYEDAERRNRQRFSGTGQFSGLSSHLTSSASSSIWFSRDANGQPNSGLTFTSSLDTPDGLPVIEVFAANPNQIVVTGPGGLETTTPILVNIPKAPPIKVIPAVQPEVIPASKVSKIIPKVTVSPKVAQTSIKNYKAKSKFKIGLAPKKITLAPKVGTVKKIGVKVSKFTPKVSKVKSFTSKGKSGKGGKY
tara:strand:+ start:1913 stop:6607 length:4695 start_codon:yes stop_codon:yes gene_type:complete